MLHDGGDGGTEEVDDGEERAPPPPPPPPLSVGELPGDVGGTSRVQRAAPPLEAGSTVPCGGGGVVVVVGVGVVVCVSRWFGGEMLGKDALPECFSKLKAGIPWVSYP